MDGLKSKIKHSLQYRLSAWLSVAILGLALAAGIFSFLAAFEEANELQDEQLRQVAALVNQQHLPVNAAPLPPESPASDADAEARVIIQRIKTADAAKTNPDPAVLDVPAQLPDGIQTVQVHQDAWRVFVRTLDTGERILVAQQTAVRDEIARDSALRTVMPFIILIPILLLLMGYLIQEMFKPLKQLALELDRRPDNDLREVAAEHLPSEIRPFVTAINRLLLRVSDSVTTQRRFLADAAHELRSPLTALSLQAEGLVATDLPANAQQRLTALQQGLRRTQTLLDQLLTLARVQDGDHALHVQSSAQQVFRNVLEMLLPLADDKQIDLGVEGETDDTYITASELDLQTLIKNLVENAIRYTPPGGRVNLSIQTNPTHITLQVDDTGPGIPVSEYERVFDPFHRLLGNDAEGSGLGLSIVQTIATRIGAEISLSAAQANPDWPGLCVRVMLRR